MTETYSEYRAEIDRADAERDAMKAAKAAANLCEVMGCEEAPLLDLAHCLSHFPHHDHCDKEECAVLDPLCEVAQVGAKGAAPLALDGNGGQDENSPAPGANLTVAKGHPTGVGLEEVTIHAEPGGNQEGKA